MAYDAIPKNARDATITISDDTGSPITFEILYEPGDASFQGFSPGGSEVVPLYDRGSFITLRKTKDQHPTFSFTFWLTEFVNATDGTPFDAFLKLGAFASGVSTLGASADVWTVDLQLDIEGTNIGSATDNTLTLDDCHATIDLSEGEEVTSGTVNGTCYGAWNFASA